MTASRQIGQFVAAADNLSLSEAERHQCFRALLDTIAVALAGRSEPAVRLARAHVAADLGRGEAIVWACGQTLPPVQAAWLNGITSHVLDFDDVMAPMRGHVSVALIPALLALAPQARATGADFARAYAVGFEVVARLSRALASAHYAKGWHATSTLGAIGAAAAGAALLRLDAEQTANALGLAVAQAAGTRQNFGTMAKPFQVGECGAVAVRSVLLAQLGFDASPEALDGPAGFTALYAPGAALGEVLDGLGQATLSLLPVGIEVKKYPCCYATHLALDALLALRQANGLTPNQVERIEVTASHRALEALTDGPPANTLSAKFSMAYCLALALQDGSVRLSAFAGELSSRVLDFLPRIAVVEHDGPVYPRFAELRLTLTDGRVLHRRTERLRGGADDPLSDDELIAKAQDCLDYSGVSFSADDFANALFGLESRSVNDVLRIVNSSN